MAYVLDVLSNDVPHNCIGINGTRALIDIFLFLDNIIHDVIWYKIIDLIDNVSDHLPLFVYLNVPYRMYMHYLVFLMPDQTGVGLIVKQFNFIKTFLYIKRKENVFIIILIFP